MTGGRPRRPPGQGWTERRPSERAGATDPARYVAYQAMQAVGAGAYANLDVPARIRRSVLQRRDAAFVTELVYGATRMRGFYDAVVERCAGRRLADIDVDLLDVLRLGAHQLLGMRVGAHAAVDQAVALARQVRGGGAAGFVNAVLRRVSEKDARDWQGILTRDMEPTDALALAHSHPAWIVHALRAALLGHAAATDDTVDLELASLLVADNAPALVSLVARPGLSDIDELVYRGARASTLSPLGAVLRHGGDPASFAAVREGRAAVQDEGSQLVTLALAAAEPGPGDERRAWLDLCAGPGGKAALLAALCAPQGVTLFANDVSAHRSDLVRGAVRAAVDAGAQVMVGTGDGCLIGQEEPASFDKVLLDAPCTGLGALRRRPEARWRRRPEDLPELTGLQRRLLASALAAARPGGLVAYVTCSPHLAETRHLVEDVLRRTPGVSTVDAQPLVRDAEGDPVAGLGKPPFAQLWPHRHGSDAMFLALLRRDA